MKRPAALASARLSLAILFAASLPLAAARRPDDALALVPADATSVGVVRISDLRSSPLSARLFADMDHITVDGDAARFLEDAHLRLKEDVDTVVVSGNLRGEKHGSALVLFEGRFEPAKLAAAVEARGARKISGAGGDYYQLPCGRGDTRCEGKPDGAVAFVSTHLVVAGSETEVVQALARRESGGSGFGSGSGLGRHLSRVDTGSSAWALVDLTRLPASMRDHRVSIHGDGDGSSENAAALFGAMKNVRLLALQATASGDALKVSATGVTSDEETRGLIEDSLRGLLAAWRLAVQDKNPDLVSVLRKFKVASDREGVTISGTIPGAAIRAFTEKKVAVK